MNRTAPNLKEGGFSEYGDMLCGVGSEPWPTKLHNNFFTGLVLLRTLWPILTLGCVYMVNSDKRSAFEWCLDLREQQIKWIKQRKCEFLGLRGILGGARRGGRQ
jgi:hypothetical protein